MKISVVLNAQEILAFTPLGESDLVTNIFLILRSFSSFFLQSPLGTFSWYLSKNTTVTDTFLLLLLLLLLPLSEEERSLDVVEGVTYIIYEMYSEL